MRTLGLLLPGLLLAAVFPPAVRAATAATIAIDRWTVDGGGMGFSQAGPFILGGTIGQHDAVRVERLQFVLTGGFWSPGATTPVGIDDGPGPVADALPSEARIHALAPNPAVTGTRIAFDLPAPRDVDVRIFDVRGALVRTLAAGGWPAGRHSLDWDGLSGNGSRAAPGLYLVRVRLGTLQRSQKLIKLR